MASSTIHGNRRRLARHTRQVYLAAKQRDRYARTLTLFRGQVERSGISEAEFSALIEEAREEVFREKQSQTGEDDAST